MHKYDEICRAAKHILILFWIFKFLASYDFNTCLNIKMDQKRLFLWFLSRKECELAGPGLKIRFIIGHLEHASGVLNICEHWYCIPPLRSFPCPPLHPIG